MNPTTTKEANDWIAWQMLQARCITPDEAKNRGCVGVSLPLVFEDRMHVARIAKDIGKDAVFVMEQPGCISVWRANPPARLVPPSDRIPTKCGKGGRYD
jgi:hypothetical protein